jgi:hypothetical protein
MVLVALALSWLARGEAVLGYWKRHQKKDLEQVRDV